MRARRLAPADLHRCAATLGVAADDSLADAKTAWRALCRDLHPDRPGGDATRMAEVNAAWEAIEGHHAAPAEPAPQQAHKTHTASTSFVGAHCRPAWTRAANRTAVTTLMEMAAKRAQDLRRCDPVSAFLGLPLRSWVYQDPLTVHIFHALRHDDTGIVFFFRTHLHAGTNMVTIPHTTVRGGKVFVSEHQARSIVFDVRNRHLRSLPFSGGPLPITMIFGDEAAIHAQLDTIASVVGGAEDEQDAIASLRRTRVPKPIAAFNRIVLRPLADGIGAAWTALRALRARVRTRKAGARKPT